MSEVDDLVETWLRYAREDLDSAARMLVDRAHHQPRQACFSAQQAAKKAIKAVFVARQVDYPMIHDLTELIAALGGGHAVSSRRGDVSWLSRWAVGTRYPGDPEPSWQDADRAVAIARDVMAGAEKDARPA